MIFIPAYGTIIGGWFGAWPMPLDWERPWQVLVLFFFPDIHPIELLLVYDGGELIVLLLLI